MKKVINLLVLVITALTLSACVQVTTEPALKKNQMAISSVRGTPINYAMGSSFSLSPKYVKDTSLKAEQTQAVYKHYTDAIVFDLQSNGFVLTNMQEQAAFHVGFGLALSDDFSDDKINEKFGVTPGLPEQVGLKKGSFLIYIEDVKTSKRVWRGIAQGFAHKELTPEQRKQRAAIVIAAVMKQFHQSN